jgi:hypothetical protein
VSHIPSIFTAPNFYHAMRVGATLGRVGERCREALRRAGRNRREMTPIGLGQGMTVSKISRIDSDVGTSLC